ncbi:UDP-N-acetylmuramate--L-alanine ligase [Patescibacteria group bacterium]|nr:UDP-N-acetylmuramate--L-alanine ligase [Patescibacteria group bacterium]
MDLSKIKKIHHIGIGGIGVSAIARLLMELGKEVTGSDLVPSEIISQLESKGAAIKIGRHSDHHISEGVDLVIHTSAIDDNNPEYKKAVELGIPTWSYPKFLGDMMKGYLPIIVAGTHGKSTTTAMLASIFISAGLDPTVVLGANMKSIGGNAHLGLGKYFIAEGDEFREAFLNYQPVSVIINNIEADHLDYYKNVEKVIGAFNKFVKQVPRGGFIVAKAADKNVKKSLKNSQGKIITFGIEVGDYYASNIVHYGELTRFTVRGLETFNLALRVPGEHNVLNAMAAAVMSITFGIDLEDIKEGLLKFQGIQRRFEIKGRKNNIIVVDDYAHHPTEIKVTLKTAREYFPKRKIWCVFQPHSTHRTKSLFDDFITSFGDCDKLILTDVYLVPGRESEERIIIDKLKKAISKQGVDIEFVSTLPKVEKHLLKNVSSGDVVITMGAGTITSISDSLLDKL